MTSHPDLPVANLRDALPYLRRPFMPAAVKFRILRGNGTGDKARVRCAAYIDARLASERLNLVCPHLWEHRYGSVQGGMECFLTVDGLTRSDVGWSRSTSDDMGLKGLYSDALKRAAVHFGVGVSLYAVPGLVLAACDNARWFKVSERQGKDPAYYLKDAGEQELRRRYRLWLDTQGIRDFGEPLDHGDVEDEPTGEAIPEGVDPETGEVIEPERKDVERTGESDLLNAAEQVWYDGMAARFKALGMDGKAIKGALRDIGAHVPERVTSWERTLTRLPDGQKASLNVWLLEREEAGTPLEGASA